MGTVKRILGLIGRGVRGAVVAGGAVIIVTVVTLSIITWVKVSAQVSLKDPGALSTTVGESYQYSFCDPAPKSATDLCGGSFKINNPSGGKGPYHFQLETAGGFPPVGISLNLNGLLTGTPSAAGERTFTVCAVDIAGSNSCQKVKLAVAAKKPNQEKSPQNEGTQNNTPAPAQDTGTTSPNPPAQVNTPEPKELSPADKLAGSWSGKFTITFQGSQYCSTYTDNWSAEFTKTTDTSGSGKIYDTNRALIGSGNGSWSGTQWNFILGGGIITSLNITITGNSLDGSARFSGNWIPCLDYSSYTARFYGSK